MTAPIDIKGHKYNRLTAIEPTEMRNSEGILWRCICDCGEECLVSTKSLRNGNVKSCGCAKRKDIAGVKYGRLTALRPTNKRYQNSVIWNCICECGKEIEVPVKSLRSGNTKSCGCLRRDTGRHNGLNPPDKVDGTRVSSLTAKMPTSNTSGIKGVSWSKQKRKWEAYIKFKGRQYRLGLFRDKDDARKAREVAEEHLYGNFLEWYYTEYPDKLPN